MIMLSFSIDIIDIKLLVKEIQKYEKYALVMIERKYIRNNDSIVQRLP